MGRRVRVDRVVAGQVVAVAELGVAAGAEPELDHRALVGREAELAAQPPVGSLADPAHPLGLGGRRPVGAVGLLGQRAQQPVELGDQQERSERRDLGVAVRRHPAGDADHRVFAQAALDERRPASGQLVGPTSDAHEPFGAGAGHARLPGDPVLGRLDARPRPPPGVDQHPQRSDQPGHGYVDRAHDRHRLTLGKPPRRLLERPARADRWPDRRLGGERHASNATQGV